MSRRSSNFISAVLLILAIGIVALGIHQAISNSQFWITSFSTCITLLIGIVFSFGLTQKYNDFRTKKTIYQELLKDLQCDIGSNDICAITSNTQQESITMKIRSIRQKISTLKESSKTFLIEEDIEFIAQKFDEYDHIVSDHITNLKYLEQAHMDLQRPLLLIEDRIYKARMKLY